MSIVLKPDPGVFSRLMPLVIVFGAYRRYDRDPPLSDAGLQTISGAIGLARRLRAPLAYSLLIDDATETWPGVWLPECRPRVRDRVFRHMEGSIFCNREFGVVFRTHLPRETVIVGTTGDSSLCATAEDVQRFSRPLRVVGAATCGSLDDWRRSILAVERAGTPHSRAG